MRRKRNRKSVLLVCLFLCGIRQCSGQPPGLSTFLLLGIESTRFRRSDTLMMARLDTSNGSLHVLSIPRDTLVKIHGKGPGKINQAYPWGGIPMVKKTVEEWSGVKIDHVVKVNFGGFRPMIDAVGGVPVEVKEKLNYDDESGNLHIHLTPGRHVLHGEQALGFVRFRVGDPEYDIGRSKRQQQFLRAFLKRAAERKNLPRLPALIRYLYNCVETDLSLVERISLATQVIGLKKITGETVPGVPKMLYGRSYWIADAKYVEGMRNGGKW